MNPALLYGGPGEPARNLQLLAGQEGGLLARPFAELDEAVLAPFGFNFLMFWEEIVDDSS